VFSLLELVIKYFPSGDCRLTVQYFFKIQLQEKKLFVYVFSSCTKKNVKNGAFTCPENRKIWFKSVSFKYCSDVQEKKVARERKQSMLSFLPNF